MRLALYARTSTADQPRGLEGQLDQLRAYAEARGAEVSEYTDRVSGRKDRRAGLDALLEAVHRRQVDAVVCVRLDRLARSVSHLARLGADLEARGVALIVLEQSIDTSTSTGRLLFHVLSAIAEFEGDLIRERTAAAVASARRHGKHPGRPRSVGAKLLARAQRLKRGGGSIRSIAARLGVSKSALARALANAA